MDSDSLKELLDEFYPQLEALDTQCMAVRQYLKDERQITDTQFAPYLEQAGKASSVKWLASRLRVAQLLSSAMKEAQKHIEEMAGKTTTADEKPAQKTPEPARSEEKAASQKPAQKTAEPASAEEKAAREKPAQKAAEPAGAEEKAAGEDKVRDDKAGAEPQKDETKEAA